MYANKLRVLYATCNVPSVMPKHEVLVRDVNYDSLRVGARKVADLQEFTFNNFIKSPFLSNNSTEIICSSFNIQKVA